WTSKDQATVKTESSPRRVVYSEERKDDPLKNPELYTRVRISTGKVTEAERAVAHGKVTPPPAPAAAPAPAPPVTLGMGPVATAGNGFISVPEGPNAFNDAPARAPQAQPASPPGAMARGMMPPGMAPQMPMMPPYVPAGPAVVMDTTPPAGAANAFTMAG